ncbi:MAG: 1-(5-phosphoribosyl)-5-[(5-phosphoribosylamino)methylideneamino]imidazole-4-carboxamide isomerase [Kofleriaceae bacterium]|jgi:phosphoribosylformimino-5-aminoimidazole carboxamide ribotide isomerase|nr:1-(5-phosphoribosyl)-5-[(5-phosphoribosylamino)methylideneamino]imidazole-4-carboxamide isomerase [Kofleriaceae bacterium]MBP6838681.1 1-(5-phosphoribosyl)-5-[(5-phosphoribosylamino)methylideneamino]imidazole-4-carboxamide isomerase [Kofleriaceae bacterium]MBP9202330.1 1-(5-phosphoribosyl)-5-[(5-phosphoribosylamino)methylideneamino]imidazole-4-carboxamide isomerase [Kofleriaceae bacterium]
MRIYPAIDVLGGKVVRLAQGKRDQVTVYDDQPARLVARWLAAGAECLHVVDLDGAFAGAPAQLELIAALVASSPVPVQVGGGLRTRAAVEQVLAAGAARAVLGTAAIREPALVEAVCRAHPGRIVVAVDARDGWVAVDGWTQTSTIAAADLATRAAAWGATAVLYTDVARDGLREGPNVAATAALTASTRCEVIASGGVGTLADLIALRNAGVASVVVGKALYEEAFTLAAAIAVGAGRSAAGA